MVGLPPIIKDRHVPRYDFHFPSTVISKVKRKCQHEWFRSFPWLHYSVELDAVFCTTCNRAAHLVSPNDRTWFLGAAREAFLYTGYRNWKKGIEGLKTHASSRVHTKSAQLLASRQHGVPITAQLQTQLQRDQAIARKCMLTVISSLRYLMVTGQAVRGHETNTGNLMQLLIERKRDIPELEQWLQKRDNYTSPGIQNEIIEIMAHFVLRIIVAEINDADFFSVIADGTTDITGEEQFAVCVRIVDKFLKACELFLGLYNPPDAKGKTLFDSITDVLVRLGIYLTKCRGASFDGAANMSGNEKGVAARLREKQPLCMTTHCVNHSLDLALQDVSKKVDAMYEVLALVRGVSTIILDSRKRRSTYEGAVLKPCAGPDADSPDSEFALLNNQQIRQLIPMCPTRWCVRGKSLRRFLENYERVQETLKCILEDKESRISDEKRASIRGWAKKMESIETVFYLIAAVEIFTPCEQLAHALQDPKLTATGAKQSSRILHATLQDMRSDENFTRLYQQACSLGEKLDLAHPPQPRVRRPPRNLERVANPTPPVVLTPESKYRKGYFEILDLLTTQLSDRFQQESLDRLEALENILLDAVNGVPTSEAELTHRLDLHATDFDVDVLYAQLKLLKEVPGIKAVKCVADIADILCAESDTVKSLLREVIRLVVLIMTVPAATATGERSFSTLRRLKNYLRSTMKQKRLTHVMLLHVHKDLTKEIDLELVLQEFVSRNDERKQVFGRVKGN